MSISGRISLISLVAVVLIAVGTLLHVIGLATPEWSAIRTLRSFYVGLWKACVPLGCGEYNGHAADNIKSCEAFAILGMLASFVGLTMAAIDFTLPLLGKGGVKTLSLFSLAACLASLACILIAIIVWGADVHQPMRSFGYEIGFSFILSIVGGVLIAVGGGLSFLNRFAISP
ncbi:unnamed protein product [Lymnaea stagnalis]|uniref:Claudin n=1 Tax=Lymnaea stagnalis TaxID=6523 RepID=A0AAV2IED0_LYMST